MKILVILILVLLGIGIYLERAYAHIYTVIHAGGFNAPVDSNPLTIASTSDTTEKAILRYAALGDSLTAGTGAGAAKATFPYLLATRWASQGSTIELRNYAVSGYTAAELGETELEPTIANKPDVITVLIGINDARVLTPTAAFRATYERVLTALQQKTKAKIFLINIPYLGAPGLLYPPYHWILNHKIKQLNAIIAAFAKEHQLTLLDLYTPSRSAFERHPNYYSRDLFHPSEAGYMFWADTLYGSIHL